MSFATSSTVVEQGETDDELTKLKRFAKIEHMWHQEVEQTIAFMEALIPRSRPPLSMEQTRPLCEGGSAGGR